MLKHSFDYISVQVKQWLTIIIQGPPLQGFELKLRGSVVEQYSICCLEASLHGNSKGAR